MIKLEKGAKVRVRLHTGEVVVGKYDEPSLVNIKNHFVRYKDDILLARGKTRNLLHCRFVGNPCDLVPVGVSV